MVKRSTTQRDKAQYVRELRRLQKQLDNIKELRENWLKQFNELTGRNWTTTIGAEAALQVELKNNG